MTYDDLIAHYKTQAKAALALSMSQAAVSDWKRNGIPFERQAQFEKITKGKLKADPVKVPKRTAEARAQ